MANKITEQELKSIQEINEKFVKLKAQIGEVSIQKHILLHQADMIREEFMNIEKGLIQHYGENTVINLQTGEIKEKESEEEKPKSETKTIDG